MSVASDRALWFLCTVPTAVLALVMILGLHGEPATYRPGGTAGHEHHADHDHEAAPVTSR